MIPTDSPGVPRRIHLGRHDWGGGLVTSRPTSLFFSPRWLFDVSRMAQLARPVTRHRTSRTCFLFFIIKMASFVARWVPIVTSQALFGTPNLAISFFGILRVHHCLDCFLICVIQSVWLNSCPVCYILTSTFCDFYCEHKVVGSPHVHV